MKLDSINHGMQLTGKFKMAASGCKLKCAESWVRDIALYGEADGWVLLVGGNVGASPRIARELLSGLNDDRALACVEKVVDFYLRLRFVES